MCVCVCVSVCVCVCVCVCWGWREVLVQHVGVSGREEDKTCYVSCLVRS